MSSWAAGKGWPVTGLVRLRRKDTARRETGNPCWTDVSGSLQRSNNTSLRTSSRGGSSGLCRGRGCRAVWAAGLRCGGCAGASRERLSPSRQGGVVGRDGGVGSGAEGVPSRPPPRVAAPSHARSTGACAAEVRRALDQSWMPSPPASVPSCAVSSSARTLAGGSAAGNA